uniref:glycoside hydrolase family 16 protein n=1 Tax=Prevotella sp. TaxID=59823 RepID=UPI003FED4D9E
MISGAIESSGKVYYQYGRIEGRLRTTPHTGNFPAFWLMPEDNSAGWPTAGEIDLWEQIDEENKTYHTVHTHVTYDLNLARPNSGSAYTDASAYHVIAMEWTPTLLTWYVDGAKAFSYAKSTDQSLLSKGQWPYDKPFYIILNQSVGNGSWAKPCDVNFEYETLFDYVRIYQKEGQIIEKPTVSVNGVPTAAANIDFYACEGGVKLVTPENRMVRIVDLQGRTVYNRIVQGNVFVALPKGVYIIDGKKLMVN